MLIEAFIIYGNPKAEVTKMPSINKWLNKYGKYI
jgi:hypothetical protein